MDNETLLELLRCHSTPGDEGEVAALLAREWQDAGWSITRHGAYAVSARRSGAASRRPRLLITAHMDSPGFTVERRERKSLYVLPLGGAGFQGKSAPAILKTAGGKVPIRLHCRADKEGRRAYHFRDPGTPIRHGDRVCFAAEPVISRKGEITSPFLDNRLGCALLCDVARALPSDGLAFEVVVGATAAEEFGGFGATVLARAIEPDLVICLDATYESPEQRVLLGKGPVLTLSDASVLISPAMRDLVLEWFHRRGLLLQTEVYNVSGTDARAFPKVGLPAPVLALLIATRGNHSPAEVANLADYASLREVLLRFAVDPPPLLEA